MLRAFWEKPLELSFIQKIAVFALPVLFAITLHEVAHGWVASWCGDQTARLSGRLSFNPIRHIDLVGTIIVPLLMLVTSGFIFGWAKPVPVDARNMRQPRRDMGLVAMAGPLANFLMAFLWGGVGALAVYLQNNGHGFIGVPLYFMGAAGMLINLALGILNLLPLPPLDGGRLVTCLLPPRIAYQFSKIEPYSFFILIFLLVTNLLSRFLGPIIGASFAWLSGLFGI